MHYIVLFDTNIKTIEFDTDITDTIALSSIIHTKLQETYAHTSFVRIIEQTKENNKTNILASVSFRFPITLEMETSGQYEHVKTNMVVENQETIKSLFHSTTLTSLFRHFPSVRKETITISSITVNTTRLIHTDTNLFLSLPDIIDYITNKTQQIDIIAYGSITSPIYIQEPVPHYTALTSPALNASMYPMTYNYDESVLNVSGSSATRLSQPQLSAKLPIDSSFSIPISSSPSSRVEHAFINVITAINTFRQQISPPAYDSNEVWGPTM